MTGKSMLPAHCPSGYWQVYTQGKVSYAQCTVCGAVPALGIDSWNNTQMESLLSWAREAAEALAMCLPLLHMNFSSSDKDAAHEKASAILSRKPEGV